MYELLLEGILPQDWMSDYKNRNETMKVTHRSSLIRMLNWRREAQAKAVNES